MADDIVDNADDLTREYLRLVVRSCGVDKPTKEELAIAQANAGAQFKARLLSDDPAVRHDAMKELNNLSAQVKQLTGQPDAVRHNDNVKAVHAALHGGDSPQAVATPEKAHRDQERVRRDVEAGKDERGEHVEQKATATKPVGDHPKRAK